MHELVLRLSLEDPVEALLFITETESSVYVCSVFVIKEVLETGFSKGRRSTSAAVLHPLPPLLQHPSSGGGEEAAGGGGGRRVRHNN